MIRWSDLITCRQVSDIAQIQETISSITESNQRQSFIMIFEIYKDIYLDYVLNSINHCITGENTSILKPIIEKLLKIHGKEMIQIWCYLKKKKLSADLALHIPGFISNIDIFDANNANKKMLINFQNDDINNYNNQNKIFVHNLKNFKKASMDLLYSYQGEIELTFLEISCLLGKINCFKYCDTKGDVKSYEDKKKLLHYAFAGENIEIIRILLDKYKIIPSLVDIKLAIINANDILFDFLIEMKKEYKYQEDLNQIIKWCFEYEYLNGLQKIEEFSAEIILDSAINSCYNFIGDHILKMSRLELYLTSDRINNIIKHSTKNISSINEIIDYNDSIIEKFNDYIRKPEIIPTIPNIGNTCYMATNIQILINSDQFANLINKIISYTRSFDNFLLIIIDIYINFWVYNNYEIDLSPFFYILCDYKIGTMYDTHEFYSDLFSYISKTYGNIPNEIFYFKKSDSREFEHYVFAYPHEENTIQKTTEKVTESYSIYSIGVQRVQNNNTLPQVPINIPYKLTVAKQNYMIYSVTETAGNHCTVYFRRNSNFYFASDHNINAITGEKFNNVLHNNVNATIIIYESCENIIDKDKNIDEILEESSNDEIPNFDTNLKKVNLFFWQLNFNLIINVNTETTTFSDISDFILFHIFDNNISLSEKNIEYDMKHNNQKVNTRKIDKNTKLCELENDVLDNTYLVFFKNVKLKSELCNILERHCICLSNTCKCRLCDDIIGIWNIINHEKKCDYFKQFRKTYSDIEKKCESMEEIDVKSNLDISIMKENPLYEEILNINLIELNKLLETPDSTFEFLKKIGHIKENINCPKCQHLMHIEKDNSRYLHHRYRCHKCKASKSVLADTIYSKTKIAPQKFILVIYMFSCYYNRKMTHQECNVDNSTVTRIFSSLRQACESFLMDGDLEPIGGPDHIVEIDETLVSKRKYHKGRFVKEKWLFGGIDRNTNELFAYLVDDRKAETLINVIEECILPGTTIMSDEWSSYKPLNKDIELLKKYNHKTVNHSKYFVDPNDRSINTQKIERLWRSIKRFKEHGVPSKQIKLQERLCEMVLRQKYKLDEHNSFAWFMTYLIPQIDFI